MKKQIFDATEEHKNDAAFDVQDVARVKGKLADALQPVVLGINAFVQWCRNHEEDIQNWYLFFFHIDPFIDRLPKLHQKNYVALAKRGWFPDPTMPWDLSRYLASAIDEDPDAVDEVFIKSLREQLDELEKKLVELYPHRAQIFRDAFEAHREGKYSLSIPVFLIQADGMWHDRFSKNIFITRGRKDAYEEYVSQDQIPFYAPTLLSLILDSDIPVWISESGRDTHFHGLNRHEVLHGISVDYHTEEYSLKAVSLLSWLCWMLNLPDVDANDD